MDKIKPHRLLYEGLINSAENNPEKIAIISEGVSFSYSNLVHAVKLFAKAMQDNGFKRGDRCVIYMDNTWPCIISIYATLLVGGVFVVVNPQTKAEKLQYILNDCSAKIFVTDMHLVNVFSHALSEVVSLNCCFASGVVDALQYPDIISFNDILEKDTVYTASSNVIENDLASLVYTSGSTGNPKGVMHTHKSMVFALNSLIEYLRLTASDKILLVLPMAFDYGLYQLFMSMQIAGTLILERSFTYPAQIFKAINKYQVTVFPAVPTIYSMMLSMHSRSPLSFPSINIISNTAAALPADYIKKLQEIFPRALIFKMYGLTECKRVCYLEPEKILDKPSSVGKAIPGTEVFILDEKGNKLAAGEVGILHVRGSHIMLGYWNKPELSEAVLIEGKLPGEKILSTQDWFKMDADGDLYFQGRSDDIIKTRGEKVSPVEVENVLHGIKGILEAAVIGVEDDIFGQAIKCFVVLEKDKNITILDIKKTCVKKLENFMVPKYYEICDSLAKTNTGKISKKDMV